MTMAARRIDADGQDGLTQFNMRMPRALLRDLDAWVDQLNSGQRLSKVSRSDLIRLTLERACEERPDLNSIDPLPNRRKAIEAARLLGFPREILLFVQSAPTPDGEEPETLWWFRFIEHLSREQEESAKLPGWQKVLDAFEADRARSASPKSTTDVPAAAEQPVELERPPFALAEPPPVRFEQSSLGLEANPPVKFETPSPPGGRRPSNVKPYPGKKRGY